MFQPRTLKFLAIFIAVFILLLLPGLVWPGYLNSPMGIVVAIPYLSIYLFHSIGIPGLLQNNGACGWGWCAPTIFGWIFLGVFWVLVVWLLAWVITRQAR
jgi:hypothetical protein